MANQQSPYQSYPYISSPIGTISNEEQDIQGQASVIKIRDVTINEVRPIIEKILQTNIVPFLWGAPGLGKSTLVKNICEDNGWDLIDLRLSLLNPVDLRGLPVVDKKNQTADWYPPAFLPKYITKKMGILFLDEINLAPLSVQAAAYQLILDKKVGEYKFPPTWKIIAAGNRETDRANVYKISAPLANRFIHFNIIPDFDTWAQWGVGKIRQEILDFIRLRPSLLLQMPTDSEKAFSSPRSWNFLSDLMTVFGYKEEDGISDDLKKVIIGTVGEGVGREFIGFLTDYKIKDLAKKIEAFKKTGVFVMPKAESLRYAAIVAIYQTYRSGKLDEGKYKNFIQKISAEERETLKECEKEWKEKLDNKYGEKPFTI